jgi:sporulation protein YlmC with PRC-barrel domain
MTETPSDTPSANEEHKLILASRVLKTRVFNQAGEHIGSIKDLSVDRITGETRYAILSFGGFLGIGERFHPLPWQLLDFDPQQDGYVVPLDKAALEDAPTYSSDELVTLGGARHQFHRDAIYGYYGPYSPLG